MGGRRWPDPKIHQVFAACQAYEAAVRRDLISLGHSFDDGSLSWLDLHAVIFSAPPGSAVYAAINEGWTPDTYMAANIVDLLAVLAWQNTEDGSTGVRQPAPTPRPSDRTADTSGTVSAGMTEATVTTVGEFLEMRAERERLWRERHQKGA